MTSRFRYRIWFSKAAPMRYTSHLDLQRTWGRWLRRARLPVHYSQGHTPRAKLQIAMALPLGFTARRELLDLWLDAQVDEREMLAALRRSHPPGLQIIAMRQIAPEEPALQTQVRSASYVAAVPEVPDLQSRISALLAAEHACRERRGKGYDLRPLIEELAIRHDHAGTGALSMRLSAREGAMGRPDEVLRELGVDPAEAHIERLEIDLAMGNDW